MNRLFKIIFIITVILSGCSSGTLKDGEAIGENIIDIVTINKLDSLPAIIKLYNTLEDSLSINDSLGIEELNNGIIKATQGKNDTIKFCARIVMNSPEGFGSWLAEQNVKKIIGSDTFTPESLLTEINIIDFLYDKTGELSSMNEFQAAFDAHIDSLPLKTKAIVYTRTLKPAPLAKALADEAVAAAKGKDAIRMKETIGIITGVRKEYTSSKENLNKFNSTLNSIINIQSDSIIKTINFSLKEKTE